jgi:2-iminobutanoate/2-iminopropanoate deaminase
VAGKLVSDEVGPQAEKTLANLAAILASAGSSLDRVLKVNIYMPDQGDYAAMNEVYMKVS